VNRSQLLLAATVVSWASLAATAAGIPQGREQGFTSLFNGKDFTGWVYGRRANGSENRSGKGYQIENGVIFSTKDDGGNLYTEKEYADFVLRFDFKLTENANNGIGIRAPLEGDAAYVGIEIQVLDDGGSSYISTTGRSTGWCRPNAASRSRWVSGTPKRSPPEGAESPSR